MRSILLTAVLVGSIAISGYCAPKKPDWVKGKFNKYSQSDFIIGVGIAKNPDEAKEAARAEIAKVFSATVRQTSTDVNSESVSRKGKKETRTQDTRVSVATNVSTDEKIEGIKITDSWYDKKKKTHYALALLSKAKVRSDLSAQIITIEETLKARGELAKATNSVVEKIRTYNQILSLMNQKEAFEKRRRVVDESRIPDIPVGDSRSEVIKKRDKAMKRMVFVIEAEEFPRLSSAIKSKITELGFTVTDKMPKKIKKNKMILQVKCGYKLFPVERDNPRWKFFGWEGSADLVEMTSGQSSIFASIAADAEISRLSERAAKKAAEQDAERRISLLVKERIESYFFGD